ncbi:MAG: putative porin [Endomicrobiia bacterium]|nr:putative porin [Endomicrobiaceae bacterium]MDD3053207.1 putative porin [Endomicrobiaceae bacterium]
MKLKRSMMLVLGCAMMLSVKTFASGVDDLANLLAEQGVITYGQAQQIITESNEQARQELASGKAKTAPAWVQNLTFKGDLRVRAQYDWSASDKVRIRERLRFRMGAETRPIDKLTVGFGFATGALSSSTGADSSSSSTNHTFQYMDKPNLFVDYAYIQYEPYNWIAVRGGKVKAKTQVWNSSDLIWDGDYNPDGLNATASTQLSESIKLTGNAGLYTFGETRKGKDAADAYILQPVIEYKEGDIKVKAALAYQQFNFEGRNQTMLREASIGNVNYKIVNPSLSVDFSNVAGSYTLSLFGDMAQNIQSDLPKDSNGDDQTKGYLAGLGFGHAKLDTFGTWNLKAMYRYLEAYAAPDKLGDSDAYGGSAGKGFEIVANFGLTKALSLGIDYYQMTNINGDVPKSLCQFDFVCKF